MVQTPVLDSVKNGGVWVVDVNPDSCVVSPVVGVPLAVPGRPVLDNRKVTRSPSGSVAGTVNVAAEALIGKLTIVGKELTGELLYGAPALTLVCRLKSAPLQP